MYVQLYQIDYTNPVLLPFFEYGLYAGFPSPGQDYFRQEIDLSRELILNPATTSIGSVKGHGLQHLGFWHGALALVDEKLKPRHKDYVVAWADDEYLLKRLHMDNTGNYLMALDDSYLPLRITDSDDFFVYGKVTHIINSCLPVHDFEQFQEKVDLNRLLIKSKATTYIARVTGESMVDIGIWSGALAVINKLWDYQDEDLVVAWTDGGFMLKQLIVNNTGTYLRSFNKRFKPIQLTDNEDSRLWGKVTHIINYINT